MFLYVCVYVCACVPCFVLQVVLDAMRQFAGFAAAGAAAIEAQEWVKLGEAMDANFALRRSLYGDDVIGEVCLRMKV